MKNYKNYRLRLILKGDEGLDIFKKMPVIELVVEKTIKGYSRWVVTKFKLNNPNSKTLKTNCYLEFDGKKPDFDILIKEINKNFNKNKYGKINHNRFIQK